MPRGGFFHNLAKKGLAEVKHQIKEQGLQQISSAAQSVGVPNFLPTGAIQSAAQQVQAVAANTGLSGAIAQGQSAVQSVEQQTQQQIQTIAANTGVSNVVSQDLSSLQSAGQQAQQQIQTIVANTGVSNVVSQDLSSLQSAGQQAQQQIQSMETNLGLNSNNQQDATGQNAQNTSNQSDNSNNNPSNQDLSKDLHDLSRLGRVVYSSLPNDHKPQQSSMITVAEVEPTSPASITLNGCSGQNAMKDGYCSASMPSMNICTSCYHMYISTSWFASSFKRVEYLPGSRNGCDMAVKAVRDVWVNINGIAARQQGLLLQQLAQQVGRITSQQAGNARLVDPSQMNMNIARKQVQGKQAVAQVMELNNADGVQLTA